VGRADDGALRLVQEAEQRAVAVAEIRARRRPPSQRVAAGRLDLHHVRAGVGEQLRRVRARDPRGEVDHPDVAESLLHGVRLRAWVLLRALTDRTYVRIL